MWTVAALYKFTPIDDTAAMKADILPVCLENNVCGTLLIAPEGVNGTIGAPTKAEMENVISFLDKKLNVSEGELKYSTAAEKPFNRIKVRLKKELITLRAPEADPNEQAGTYVSPEEWNDLINDPEVLLLDTRNDYETKVGIFKNAVDPDIKVFTEFKDYVQKELDPQKHKKVAMYCTGGIRCEKASSYMLAHGFENVYHLKGGILKYLETIPADQSQWDGDCFVFDMRVAVGHGLEENKDWAVCFGCREPISPEEMKQDSYEKGVSCLHCIDNLTEERAKSLRARHKYYTETLRNEDKGQDAKSQ